jgi:capsular polysaccharide biosynthesis protein
MPVSGSVDLFDSSQPFSPSILFTSSHPSLDWFMNLLAATLRARLVRSARRSLAIRHAAKWFLFISSCLRWSIQTKDKRFLRVLVGFGSDRARIAATLRLASISAPGLVSPKRDHFVPHPYDAETSRHRRALSQLYAVSVLKKLGRFDEAEIALRLLSSAPQKNVRAQALMALADVLLVQAAWTIEFDAYHASGVALNPIDLGLTAAPRTGWRRHTAQTACSLLAEVVKELPSDKNALWLYAYALMILGCYRNSLTYFRTYFDLAPPIFELRSILNAVSFVVSQDLAKQISTENSGRWIGMIDIGTRKIASARSIPPIMKKHCHETYARCTLTGSVTHFYGREEVEHPFRIDFDAVDTFSASDVEILPHHGMIATSEYLISDTSHVKPVHWGTFTSSVQGIDGDSALLLRKRATDIDVDRSIYFGHNGNYYHWILEDLPRLITLMRRGVEGFFLVDQGIKPWQEEVLIASGCPPERWRCADFTMPVRCREVTATTMMSRDLSVHPMAARLIREQLVPADLRERHKGHRLLYLARSTNAVRKTGLVNEAAVQKHFISLGFEIIDPSSMTFADQQRVFSEARVIAGAGGAAFTNLVFAPSGAVSLVLAPAGSYCETFASLGAAIGQKMLTCLGDTYPRPDYTWINTVHDFTIDTNTLRRATERALCISA